MCTFVTAFYDLPAIDNNPKRRSKSTYFKLFEGINLIRHPLIIFIEKKNFDELSKIICNLKDDNLIKKRKILIKEFNELYYYKKYTEIQNYSFYDEYNPNHESHRYTIVMLSKIHLVTEVAKLNPYNTTHFAWIDFGISHVTYIDPVIIDNIVANIPDKFKVGAISPINKTSVQNRKEYHSKICTYSIGGFFTTSGINAFKYQEMFDKEADVMFNLKYSNTDEQITSILISENEDFFDLYPSGGYCPFDNYCNITKDEKGVVYMIELCRMRNLHKLACKFGKSLIDSITKGFVRLQNKDFIYTLYNLYICAYYCDKEYAKKIGNDAVLVYNYCYTIKKSEFDVLRNFGANLKFLDIYFDKPILSREQFLESDTFKYAFLFM